MTHPSGRSDTLAELARAAAPQPGGVRSHRPPAPSSRPGRGTESFPGLTACGKRSGHGWEAIAARARRVHGALRPGRASEGPGAGPG